MSGAVKTQVCITVDVEPSIAGAFAAPGQFKPLIHEPVAGIVEGRSEALGFITRTLREAGLKATFFVESMHTAYFDERQMGRYIDDLKSAGQDIQLHVHPCWLTFRDGKPDLDNFVSDACADHSEARLVDILGRGIAQFERWTGARPAGLRTGSFSVSRNVFKAMARLGLRVSSTICVAHAPPEERALRLHAGAHEIEGVREFPVTCFRDRGPVGRGRLRGLQITACAAWELEHLLDAAHERGYAYVVIVTHPFEFLKRDSFRYARIDANRINQRRFRALCAFLNANADRFAVTTLAELAGQTPRGLNGEPRMLDGRALSSLMRSAQNVLNDHIWRL
jgi:peptidoglycan/xylan/chitin deacetylase (PgdA/CDA1 family)